MSILVALTGGGCGVVATDQIRTEDDGSQRFDFPKVIRLPNRVLAGFAGLLEVDGKPVSLSLAELAGRDSKTIGDLAVRCREFFCRAIERHPKGELEHRRLDIELLGPERVGGLRPVTIRAITFRAKQGRVHGEVETFRHACAGDESAHRAIERDVAQFPDGGAPQELRAAADALIRKGIDAAGPHEWFPEKKSCGGEPVVLGFPH